MNQRGSVLPAVAFLFGAAVVVLIFGYMLWPKDSDVNITGIDVSKVVKNGNANGNTNANTNANSNTNATTDATKDWKTLKSDELALTFKYPADLEEAKVTFSNGDTGRKFNVAFSGTPQGVAGKVVALGGVTTNYTYGAGSSFTTYSGFIQEGSRYYIRDNLGKKSEEITPVKVLTIDNNVILKVNRESFPVTEPNSPALYNGFGVIGFGAVMNLTGGSFPGLQFLVQDPSIISPETFDQILSTFTFTK